MFVFEPPLTGGFLCCVLYGKLNPDPTVSRDGDTEAIAFRDYSKRQKSFYFDFNKWQ